MNERYQIVQGGVVKDNLTGWVYQRSNIAGYLNKLTRKHEADLRQARYEERERIAQQLEENGLMAVAVIIRAMPEKTDDEQ